MSDRELTHRADTARDENHRTWYRDGLRFECTGCGECCRGVGYVWLSDREVVALAEHLSLDLHAFGRRYLRRVGVRLSLLDGRDGHCVFWDQESGCTVYGARPRQCRTYPFWDANLVSLGSWRKTAADCEGIGKGRLYEQQEIVALDTTDISVPVTESCADGR